MLFLKALHIIGFVSWFAGLFYLVRMFVYHAEAQEKAEPEKGILSRQFNLMERRVYRIICNPALWITWIAGLLMLALDWSGIDRRGYFITGTPGWMTVKLALLILLTAYHYGCRRVIAQMEAGRRPYTGWQFRLLNELPTLLLIAIAFVAVCGKAGTLNYLHLVLGMAGFAGLIYLGARAYKRRSNAASKSS